jgi:hypothetical protein
MVKPLTEGEFKVTMSSPMTDVTTTAEPAVDIWTFVKELNKEGIVLDYVYNNELVEKVYRNSSCTFDHVLLPTKNDNFFIAIIINLKKTEIEGYFPLDLEKEYGIK